MGEVTFSLLFVSLKNKPKANRDGVQKTYVWALLKEGLSWYTNNFGHLFYAF